MNDIDGFRHLLPSAPPLPPGNTPSTNQTTINRRHQNAHISCPICLCSAVLPIETNCGHLFCGIFFPLIYPVLSMFAKKTLLNFKQIALFNIGGI